MENYPKVLVACPVHSCKEYCFKQWIHIVNSLSYPNYDILVVDNSSGNDFIEKFKDEVKMIKIDCYNLHPYERITKSMNKIARIFVNGDWDYWFNLEVDTHPEDKDVIEKLMKFSMMGFDWVNHAYPMRKDVNVNQLGIGCCLLSKRLIKQYNWQYAGDVSPDGFMWGKMRKTTEYKVIDIWNYLKIKHLAS